MIFFEINGARTIASKENWVRVRIRFGLGLELELGLGGGGGGGVGGGGNFPRGQCPRTEINTFMLYFGALL